MILMSVITVQAQEPYVVYDQENEAITFYYDTQETARNGYNIRSIIDDEFTGFSDLSRYSIHITSIKTVEFDSSFANMSLTSTYRWFGDFSNLTEIKGLENINTQNLKDMFGMFSGCRNLKSLDLSGFKADHLTNIYFMFAYCSSLEELDLSGFNTENVTAISMMFMGCEKLKSVDLSSFNTENVTVTNFMFQGCSNLTTIYVGDGWNIGKAAIEYTYNMFEGCNSLVGGKGTKYDSNYTDGTYARIDGGTDAPGYLTQKVSTDINHLMSDERRGESIYTLGGQRLSSPKKGVNIIDGRKVMIR